MNRAGPAPDPDEVLSTRLRDLALVELDALVAGDARAIAAYADDVADALREARARIAASTCAAARGADRSGLARRPPAGVDPAPPGRPGFAPARGAGDAARALAAGDLHP